MLSVTKSQPELDRYHSAFKKKRD